MSVTSRSTSTELDLGHHEGAVEAVPHRPGRVVPISACIRLDEAIVETLARRDGCLGERRRAIHGVGEPHAVPMQRGRLRETVDETQANLLTAAHLQGPVPE